MSKLLLIQAVHSIAKLQPTFLQFLHTRIQPSEIEYSCITILIMTHTCLCSTQLAVINENSRLEHFKWRHDQYCLLLVGECVIAPRKMCICIYIPVFCFYTAIMWGATLVILNITILPSTIDTCILLLGERITRTTQPRSLTTDYPSPPLTFPVWTHFYLFYQNFIFFIPSLVFKLTSWLYHLTNLFCIYIFS